MCLDDVRVALEASGVLNRIRSSCPPCTSLAVKNHRCACRERRREIALNRKRYLAVLWETVWRINPARRHAWTPWVNCMPSFVRNLLASKDVVSACVSAEYSFADVENSWMLLDYWWQSQSCQAQGRHEMSEQTSFQNAHLQFMPLPGYWNASKQQKLLPLLEMKNQFPSRSSVLGISPEDESGKYFFSVHMYVAQYREGQWYLLISERNSMSSLQMQ